MKNDGGSTYSLADARLESITFANRSITSLVSEAILIKHKDTADWTSCYCDSCEELRKEMRMQRTLFDNMIDACVPRSRIGDPQSSVDGARYIQPKAGTIQAAMLEAFRVLGAASANEAAAYCVRQLGGRTHESYRKRTKELVDRGLIRKCDSRLCRHVRSSVSVDIYKVVQ